MNRDGERQSGPSQLFRPSAEISAHNRDKGEKMGGDSLIEAFWQARQAGIYFPPAYFGKLSIDEAYVVQLGLIERRRTLGERQIGWKVGLTAPAIQQQFGFHEPVFGCVLESKPSGHVFGPRDLIVPGFENELCMRLSAIWPARSAWRTLVLPST